MESMETKSIFPLIFVSMRFQEFEGGYQASFPESKL